MNTLLEQLHDIEGIDLISFWPLAIGWWILIIAALALIGGAGCALWYWVAFRRSWKHDTLTKLAGLENHLNGETARDILIDLSEYLRRIALRRFSRAECAGLMGDEWLQWLSHRDPKKFDWKNKGKLLIDAPYAPRIDQQSIHQIKELIHAVREWV